VIPLPDLLAIIGLAFVTSLVVGALGLGILHAARRATMLTQLMIVVLTATLSVSAGMIAVSQAMFLSPHDFAVAMWVTAASTVVSLAVAVVLGRAFARQVKRLRALTREVGEGARLSAPSAQPRQSEVAQLEDELARASEKLDAARAEVDALDASRRELVAWISHDLRTPLAGLQAMAEALEDGLAPDPARFLRQMRSQVDHLSGLVDELFALSKIQSGRLELDLEPVSLYDLVSDAVAELGALAASRDIEIAESPSPDLIVMGDARELARVVGNLLMNAIQHSPVGGRITVTTRDNGDGTALLTVIDAGGGIPESDLPMIFLAGWRGAPARTPSEVGAGAGLGLAIAHGIVTAHDGEISARNVEGGCRFDVVLPRAAVS
jgi:signal transduction histidine kinase